MSGIPQGDDIEVMIARLDDKWRELKKLLRAEEDWPLEEEPDIPIYLQGLDQEETEGDGLGKAWWSSLLPPKKASIEVNPLEADAIFTGVEKLDEDVQIQERFAKMQWQNRGLIVYSIICTVMFLYMLFSLFLINDNHAANPNRMEQAKERQPAVIAKAPSSGIAATPDTTVSPPAGSVLASAASIPGGTQETSGTPAGQNSLAVLGATQAAETPRTDYVGSATSNKYHYPSCKWAKYIGPRNLRLFHSAAEAQKAGYISCPTCQPPLTDGTQASAR